MTARREEIRCFTRPHKNTILLFTPSLVLCWSVFRGPTPCCLFTGSVYAGLPHQFFLRMSQQRKTLFPWNSNQISVEIQTGLTFCHRSTGPMTCWFFTQASQRLKKEQRQHVQMHLQILPVHFLAASKLPIAPEMNQNTEVLKSAHLQGNSASAL